jgi:hypothetical protein
LRGSTSGPRLQRRQPLRIPTIIPEETSITKRRCVGARRLKILGPRIIPNNVRPDPSGACSSHCVGLSHALPAWPSWAPGRLASNRQRAVHGQAAGTSATAPPCSRPHVPPSWALAPLACQKRGAFGHRTLLEPWYCSTRKLLPRGHEHTNTPSRSHVLRLFRSSCARPTRLTLAINNTPLLTHPTINHDHHTGGNKSGSRPYVLSLG